MHDIHLIRAQPDWFDAGWARRGLKGFSAELLVLDECGHVPYVEQPEQLFNAIRRFLAESHGSLRSGHAHTDHHASP